MMNQPREPKGKHNGGQFKDTGASGHANSLPPQLSDEQAEALGEYAMESDDNWVDTPEGRHEATNTMLVNSVIDSRIDYGRRWPNPEDTDEWREKHGWDKRDISPQGTLPDPNHTYPDYKTFEKEYVKPLLKKNGGVRRYDVGRVSQYLGVSAHGGWSARRMYAQDTDGHLTKLALRTGDRKAPQGEPTQAEKALTHLSVKDNEAAFRALPKERQEQLYEKEGRMAADDGAASYDPTGDRVHVVSRQGALGYVMDRYPELFTHKGWRQTNEGGLPLWVAPKDGHAHDPVNDICRWSGQSRRKVLRTLGEVSFNTRTYPPAEEQ